MRCNDPLVSLAIKLFEYLSLSVIFLILGISSQNKKELADYMRIPYSFNPKVLKNFKKYNRVQAKFFYLVAIIYIVFMVIDCILFKDEPSLGMYVLASIVAVVVLVLGMIIWDKIESKELNDKK